MQRLPPHLLDRVLADVIDNDDIPVPRHRTACLRVNKSFYLAAIPTLYKAPGVRLLDSFFAATSPPPAGDVTEISASDLVDTGHFKLAGLRYVRKLHIDSSRMYEPSDDEEDLQMSDEQKRLLATAEEEIRVAQFLRAEKSLRELPAKAMVELHSIQVGEVEYQHPGSSASVYWTDPRLCRLIPVLAQTLRPEYWCQAYRRAGYLTLNPSPQLMTPAYIPIPSIINHVNIFDDFQIWPGRTNYLYIHEDSREILEKGVLFQPTEEREEVDAEDVYHWIEEVMVRAFPQMETWRSDNQDGAGAEEQMTESAGNEAGHASDENGDEDEDDYDRPIPREVCQRTKIIIGGVALSAQDRVTVKKGPPGEGVGAEAKAQENDVIQEVQTYLRRIFAPCIGIGEEELNQVAQIEVRKAIDMPPCPACGIHL